MSMADFRRHYEERHVPLVARLLPRPLDYRRNYVVEGEPHRHRPHGRGPPAGRAPVRRAHRAHVREPGGLRPGRSPPCPTPRSAGSSPRTRSASSTARRCAPTSSRSSARPRTSPGRRPGPPAGRRASPRAGPAGPRAAAPGVSASASSARSSTAATRAATASATTAATAPMIPIPATITAPPITRPAVVTGTWSPYPTVVKVVSAHHRASPAEPRVLPGRFRSTAHRPSPPARTTSADTAVTARLSRADHAPHDPSGGGHGDILAAVHPRRVSHRRRPAVLSLMWTWCSTSGGRRAPSPSGPAGTP